jgi:hypothetical protein
MTKSETTEAPTSQDTLNKLISEANRLGRLMKLLHDAVSADMGAVLDDGYDDEFADWHETLVRIGAILTLVRDTPNANINPEGIAAIRHQVEAAAEIERQDWVMHLLDEVYALSPATY